MATEERRGVTVFQADGALECGMRDGGVDVEISGGGFGRFLRVLKAFFLLDPGESGDESAQSQLDEGDVAKETIDF